MVSGIGGRRRALGVLLVCLAVWPLLHIGLVARFAVDPWELFGWAMYARPAARVQVALEAERAGETKPLRAMGEARRRVERFARRRSALGRLADPEPLARGILAEDETIEAVWVVMRRIELDAQSARLVAHEERQRLARAALLPGEPRARD